MRSYEEAVKQFEHERVTAHERAQREWPLVVTGPRPVRRYANFMLTARLTTDSFRPDAGPELARVLRQLADKLDRDGAAEHPHTILTDANGNRVGDALFS